MGSRIADTAAHKLRRAIREAGGVEVFAVGDVEDGTIVEVTVTCRGVEDRVTALLDRPRAGQVVIHNHPSGDLRPSDADMQLASYYGDNGVGVVIVDSAVTRTNFVVEPHKVVDHAVDPELVRKFFEVDLARALPDLEPRPGQLDMALRVAESFTHNRPLVVEAGTGTGKSLAYLVPAALWAIANDSKVVISTHTKALQSQLLGTDLPVLGRAGLPATYAVLQGRANYLCKRRLGLAIEEDKDRPADERVELEAIAGWDKTTKLGTRGDLPIDIDPTTWERVESDSDLTLRVKCPHYASCHYYQSRRNAAASHLVVVNHALLLSDLAVRDEGGSGILPKYRRLVLDEAHHLEDAATGAIHVRVTSRGVARAVAPLLTNKRRRGALDRLVAAVDRPNTPLFPEARDKLIEAVADATGIAPITSEAAKAALAVLATEAIGPDGAPFRVTEANEESEQFKNGVAPTVLELAASLEQLHGALDAVLAPLEDIVLPDVDAQPLLDVRRAARKIGGHADAARSFLQHDNERCRWVEAERGRERGAEASLEVAPIDVARTLRRVLWEKFPGTVATSATLAVAGRFEFWLRRVGLLWADLPGRDDDLDDDAGGGARGSGRAPVDTAVVPSPFDHATQAVLALPRDLPEPESEAFLAATTDAIVEAVRISDGGAFVLCTSYAAVDHYANALRRRLPADQPVLAQGRAARSSLLDRFREDRRAVLVGTDAFWEGVSVKGDGLRLVIIPRLPFRVPTEPLRLSRYERIARSGADPFRAFSLPEATIKLRQGYGRLIRHKTDRGAVLLLDRRIHDRAYGQIMLRSLPPARRVIGPWSRIAQELRAFYASRGLGV